MSESILFVLVEWSIRAATLTVLMGGLLSVLRVRDVHVRLTFWTVVLAGLLLMPIPMVVMSPIPVWVTAETPAPPAFVERSSAVEPSAVEATAPIAERGRRLGAIDYLVALWAIGAIVMLVRLAIGLRLGFKLRKTGRFVEHGALESSAVHVPVTVGILRPIVILPSDWRTWSDNKLRAVLAHEFAHVDRRDPLRQMAASVFRAIAWFHPVAWWLRSHLVELAELASDDAAVAATGDRILYADTLLEFIGRARGRVGLEGVSMASPTTRARRMERLLDDNHRPSLPLSFAGNLALLALIVPVLNVGALLRPQTMKAEPLVLVRPPVAVVPQVAVPRPASVPCGGQMVYQKWLEEDMAYLLTRIERDEFQRSETAEHCRSFIERYWQVRPPEMKTEHYRRIAYANERFAASVPGWRTDRGRILIKYGPPDEIESHPSGSSSRTYPFEVWRYRWIEGVGEDVMMEFVDSKKNGEYPMLAMRDAAALALLRTPPGSGPTDASTPRMVMILLDPRVYLDGRDFGSHGMKVFSGYTVKVDIKGVGRFILSLDKRDDAELVEVGTTTGRRIEVEVGGHSMRIDCAADVSPGGRTIVYGRLEASKQPTADLEITASK